MLFELVMVAAKTWRRLKGGNQSPKVVQGVTFSNGVEVANTPARAQTGLITENQPRGESLCHVNFV